MSDFSIHPETRVSSVHLTISDLERALHFYRDTLGFRVLERKESTVALTPDGTAPLITLTGQPNARPRPRRTTGLYHMAILVPTRADLARTLHHLTEVGYPLEGWADHLVSEAIYLADPEGNGIEIYRDRARDQWPRRNGQIQMATDPLDVDGMLAEADKRSWDGLPPQTRIGHIHLQVSDLRQAEMFYHGLLGFDVVTRDYPGALFVSAGGYHHHIGLNTWAGTGAPQPPPDSAGLRDFTLTLPDRAEWQRMVERLKQAHVELSEQDDGISLHDPSGNGIRLIPTT
jgi:catechol 2,3-dioxygenase